MKVNQSVDEIVVIAHNIRSIYNVGSILRTCDGFGVTKLYLSGYTPAPDKGLPHIRAKIQTALHKTALGAEQIVAIQSASDIYQLIEQLRADGYYILGLEQDQQAIALTNFCQPNINRFAVLLGEETKGLTPELRRACDSLVEIPMFGRKESFNVAVAAGIALYELRRKNRHFK
jgi:tRNA G18 (ribose-2'-O)-methylase SpoU